MTAGCRFAAAVPEVQRDERRAPGRERGAEGTEGRRALVEHDLDRYPVVARQGQGERRVA